MDLYKNDHFCKLSFFKAIQATKMSFTIFQNEKTPSQAIKTRSSKSRKIDIISKGLTHVFSPKMAIFSNCFFQAIWAWKMSFRIFENEKTPFQAIKTRISKSRKIAILLKGLSDGFWTKMVIFPSSFFKGNIGQENVFYNILERKNACLGQKNKKFKKSIKCHFSKRVNPWFWSKYGHFSNFFFLGKTGQENVFYNIL